MKYYELMKSAANSVGMEFNEDKYEKFIKYMRLVQEWNEKINLTAITEDDEFIKKHFIDCIKAFKSDQMKEANSIIDVGTGAGFPGIPIAIMRDDVEVCLLDSLNKRINFLNTVVRELGLKNVTTIHSRAEDGARKKELRESFDVATSRAVANMAVLSEYCIPYVKVNGYFIALKGPAIEEELSNAKNAIGTLGGKLKNVIELEIEDTDLKHNIVIVEKVKPCSNVYPRKAGVISKKPLK
ncbi:16S rRNA (guanine(527)-N(7))-methyltransferase RsmG [Clostridium sp. MSJ-8]|uniref:16S rRNA (guanine(527)-N(7))-methyltransferase RsmG n=1 Tax=Clostridium sp. MSJ-8 TaxID=2841510 RepID=UPI001C0E8F29|nr:16S rRNA (guanine(527)-N(7))-methyltransferase RsmG [Clostridium sp. MSJ-8]MBU5487453.1 16S rRNA (guanine(527)-N(7))-methyltransferase RsmG [Clostridium sp. MSJ-8]